LEITYFVGGLRLRERQGGWTQFGCGGEVVDTAQCSFAVHSLNSGSFSFFSLIQPSFRPALAEGHGWSGGLGRACQRRGDSGCRRGASQIRIVVIGSSTTRSLHRRVRIFITVGGWWVGGIHSKAVRLQNSLKISVNHSRRVGATGDENRCRGLRKALFSTGWIFGVPIVLEAERMRRFVPER